MKTIAPVQAVAWIVGTLLLVPGSVYKVMHGLKEVHKPSHYLCRIVQTGPQREALKTPYLAELIDLSADRPILDSQFDSLLAQKKLCSSPVIKTALLKVIKPDTVYIDYTVRQPLAWLYDFENVALDEEGVPFPISPFFSPKKLPQIIIGIKTFTWNQPLKEERVVLALTFLKMMLEYSLPVVSLDVRASTAPSLGQREVVVVLKEKGVSKFLRLTPKNFAQELGNYLELRKTLPLEKQVIDLRIPQLAFIEMSKESV